jgi:hypothetical protein
MMLINSVSARFRIGQVMANKSQLGTCFAVMCQILGSENAPHALAGRMITPGVSE